MRAVIQRAKKAEVAINKEIVGKIENGLMILIGIEENDNEEDIAWLTNKIVNLRIFDDDKGIMNLSLLQIEGDILLVSQFTLHAMVAKGNRPSYIKAAKPEIAIPIYEKMIHSLEKALDKQIQTGRFGADMQVTLTNDGPVTIIIDTKNKE
jgi:D-tyrosyl-tRNA(Tyr) deacylase